jgi:hypothetical protein
LRDVLREGEAVGAVQVRYPHETGLLDGLSGRRRQDVGRAWVEWYNMSLALEQIIITLGGKVDDAYEPTFVLPENLRRSARRPRTDAGHRRFRG